MWIVCISKRSVRCLEIIVSGHSVAIIIVGVILLVSVVIVIIIVIIIRFVGVVQ